MKNYTKEEMEEKVLRLMRFFEEEGYDEEEAIEIMEITIDILINKIEQGDE